MTYIKQVRECCENNKGALLDVSLVKDSVFSEIPYKTLLKILNSLEEEKIVTSVSKGVWNDKNISEKRTGDKLPP